MKREVQKAEEEIKQQEASASRMRNMLEEERSEADRKARAARSAAAMAENAAEQARQDAAGTTKLNEALQVCTFSENVYELQLYSEFLL